MKTQSDGDVQKVRKALSEMEKSNPRKEVVLPLMKSCFSERRYFVMNDADCVLTIMGEFPALKMSSVVSLCVHMTIVCY